jgi:hypothetical protein
MKQILYGKANKNSRRKSYPAYLLMVCFCLAMSACGGGGSTAGSISGFVKDGDNPVAGVTVTLQGSDISSVTDASGAFTLYNVPAGTSRISAWKEGYYCGLLVDVNVPASGVVVSIRRHLLIDYSSYEWLLPEGENGCIQCHPALTAMSKQDAHMGSAANPRFLSSYYGRDVLGNQSPDTTYKIITNQWGTFEVPEPYDTTKPYYGPGWRIDFPNDKGACTSCHIPGAATNGDVDPGSVTGADKYGIHCDFCHKVGNVHLEKNTGMPSVSLPGVQSIDLFRPDTASWAQLFMGSLADGNSGDEGVLSPYGGYNVATLEAKRAVYGESRYCASCHYGGFWGQPVYTSYQEWAQSPYGDATSAKFKTCQGCHMPSPTIYNGSVLTNIAPGKGGIKRNPNSLHAHNMTITAEMLQKSTLTMKATASDVSVSGNEITVDVTLTNNQTGHHIPTDNPWRHMILLVEARDANGNLLTLKSGSTLPAWCGVGDYASGYYAYMPGKAYAKVLREMWTNVVPAVSYWRHTTVDSDTRLAALASDSTRYVFYTLGAGSTVTVKLIYRRAYIDMMAQKKWTSPDIVMARQTFKF